MGGTVQSYSHDTTEDRKAYLEFGKGCAMGENHKNGNRKEPLSVVIFWLIVVWAPRMFVFTFPFDGVFEDSWWRPYYQPPLSWIIFVGSIYIGFIWPCVAPDRPPWTELRSHCEFRKKDKE